MNFPELSMLSNLFTDQGLLNQISQTGYLLQRSCVVIVAAFIALRFKKVRQTVRGAELKWQFRILAIFVFGLLAIAGSHNGIKIDVLKGWSSAEETSWRTANLKPTEAIVGFRDTMILISGFIGGPWVGFGAGLLAGVERYALGGLAGFPSCFATITLGFCAGLLRHLKPSCLATAPRIIIWTIIGTAMHRVILYFMIGPPYNLLFAKNVFLPVLVVNIFGCLLFFWVFRDLDREDLEQEVQKMRLLNLQSELRAFRAQTKPHFLKNALTNISSLIRTDAENARTYLAELRKFFADTLIFSGQDTIALVDEKIQLVRYIDLKCLNLGNKLSPVTYCIPDEIGHFQVVPGCLLTLVENALDHGFVGRQPPYELSVSAKNDGEHLLLQVTDNGQGISPEHLLELGKGPVDSKNEGGGMALHQLLQSLRLVFGEKTSLHFDSVLGKGTVVSITHPKKSKAC